MPADIVQRAREAFDAIKREGLMTIEITPSGGFCLDRGLELGLYSIDDMQRAEQQYIHEHVMPALEAVRTRGVAWVRFNENHGDHLQYGEHWGIFRPLAVCDADIQYHRRLAQDVLEAIERRGIEWVRNSDLGYMLEQGVKDRYLTEQQIDAAQQRYVAILN